MTPCRADLLCYPCPSVFLCIFNESCCYLTHLPPPHPLNHRLPTLSPPAHRLLVFFQFLTNVILSESDPSPPVVGVGMTVRFARSSFGTHPLSLSRRRSRCFCGISGLCTHPLEPPRWMCAILSRPSFPESALVASRRFVNTNAFTFPSPPPFPLRRPCVVVVNPVVVLVVVGCVQIPRCVPRNDADCTTVLYSPKGVPWVDQVMEQMATLGE